MIEWHGHDSNIEPVMMLSQKNINKTFLNVLIEKHKQMNDRKNTVLLSHLRVLRVEDTQVLSV